MRKPSVVPMSRESDERLIEWLESRAAGESYHSIARRWGVNAADVRNAIMRVRSEEPGEPT